MIREFLGIVRPRALDFPLKWTNQDRKTSKVFENVNENNNIFLKIKPVSAMLDTHTSEYHTSAWELTDLRHFVF